MSPTRQSSAHALDLCAVILNYNGGSLLQRAVAAVSASRGIDVGVVVVDNGSSDGSMEALAEASAHAGGRHESPALLMLEAGRNLGYAAGNNLGLFGLAARYIVLLNDDAVVEPKTLGTLVRFMDRYPSVGACAPRLTWPDGRPQPYSYGMDPTPAYLLRRSRARRRARDLHDWDGDTPRPVDWVAGTCMVLRPRALSQVGLLDAGIFMYFEDNDLCLRMRRKGWQVYFVPEVAVRHYNRPSYADRVRVRNYYGGLAHFYRKHYGALPGAAMWLLGRGRLGLQRG